jgi:hypothetical protein
VSQNQRCYSYSKFVIQGDCEITWVAQKYSLRQCWALHFEEAKEEITQSGSGSNLETKYKGKQQANPETRKELNIWLKTSQGLWLGSVGPFVLMNRSCTSYVAASFW